MKTSLFKFRLRLLAAFRILTRRYNHFIIINIPDDQLEPMLREDDFVVDGLHHGLQNYNIQYIIRRIADEKDEMDLAMEKANFQAQAEINANKKTRE